MNSTSEQQDAQHLRMTTAPVPGLILSLSVPSIITCIITSVYNMADTFFVAQLGTAAVAAVGVVFSISSVLSALGFWMGTGGSSLVSLYLGGDAALACSAETATKIDKEVVEIIRTAHEKAIGILKDNMDKLHELAKYLLEKETITGDEFMAILNR